MEWELVISGVSACAAVASAFVAVSKAKEAAESTARSNRLHQKMVEMQLSEQHRQAGQLVVTADGDSAFKVMNPGAEQLKRVEVFCTGFANSTALWSRAEPNQPKRFVLKRRATVLDDVVLHWKDGFGDSRSQEVNAREIWEHLARS